MTEGISHYIAANLFSDLKFKYQKEYLKLIQEDIKLNPSEKRIKFYPKIIKEFNDRREKSKQYKKSSKKEFNLLRNEWGKFGGRY